MKMKVFTILSIAAAAAGAVAAWRTGTAIKEVARKVNPADENNIVNQAASKIVETVSGGKRKSVGDALYCTFNPDAITCNPELAKLAIEYNISYHAYNGNNEPIGINPQLLILAEQEYGL